MLYTLEGDEGTQYASVIFAHDAIQLDIATRIKSELQAYLTDNVLPYEYKEVVTAIEPATTFYDAEVSIHMYILLLKTCHLFCS